MSNVRKDKEYTIDILEYNILLGSTIRVIIIAKGVLLNIVLDVVPKVVLAVTIISY